ncbi:hypothetical protein O181_094470 [Austropuccinia psidii MF-1]|uniref:Uncharacterized protein n=1 Tax=Austropuccinia psidii MF-1 TaxID=1389203 RepID=A0A9Q3J3R6_9BASI|nr:hypothetical protein [Austropuccinia psidii MF-1]
MLLLLLDLHNCQQAEVKIFQSQYKSLVLEAKKQECELLPSLWIWEMNSYLQVKKLLNKEKREALLNGWTLMSIKGKVQQIEAWFQNQRILSEDQKKQLAQNKNNRPVEAPQLFTRKNTPTQVPNTENQAPKNNHRGKKKKEGKAKSKWKKPYPEIYKIPKKEKTAMENVFNMGRNLMEFKNKVEERMNQSFPKK